MSHILPSFSPLLKLLFWMCSQTIFKRIKTLNGWTTLTLAFLGQAINIDLPKMMLLHVKFPFLWDVSDLLLNALQLTAYAGGENTRGDCFNVKITLLRSHSSATQPWILLLLYGVSNVGDSTAERRSVVSGGSLPGILKGPLWRIQDSMFSWVYNRLKIRVFVTLDEHIFISKYRAGPFLQELALGWPP